jgi:predicted dehydrogenase/nucleoside-diphosphate-sugar epimerase
MIFESQKHGERPDTQIVRTGIVGTGYIADFHAQAIRQAKNVELLAVCDEKIKSAKSFAEKWGVRSAFDSFEAMLRNEKLDSVHLLVPPELHYPLAKIAIESGLHVLLEKPMCISIDQADELAELARHSNVRLGVGHNMLFSAPYQKLREFVHSGMLGPLDHVIINHFLELGQIRLGPFDSWVLRNPGNVILEIGPHPFSAVLDLVGKPRDILASAERSVDLPGGAHVFRRWRIHTSVGRTAVDINMNFGSGFPQRTINVRGVFGSASLDFDANTCTIDRQSTLGLDLDRYKRSGLTVRQIGTQARKTLADYVLSKLKLRRRGGPYEITFLDSIGEFYSSIIKGTELDERLSGVMGRDVVELCSKTIQAAGIASSRVPDRRPRSEAATRPTVLVIGGAGFIGRELISQLVANGYCVRVLVRTSSAMLEQFDSDHVEILRGDMGNQADLTAAMRGIEYVYHLATTQSKTWDDRLQNEVEPTRLIGESCIAAGIKRLIYTGTIDSYYAGGRAGTINEDTPIDLNIRRRNYYARAKAAGEAVLMELHRTKQLPVVIFRPGIVIGKGGNPFHFGVAMWSSPGVCEVWGDGSNALPFVLVADVAAALVRGLQIESIEGRSYNLVDLPLLTARDYLDEVQRRTGMRLSVHYRPIWRFYMTDLSKWIVKVVVGHPDRVRIPSYLDWESRTQKAVFDCTRARRELNWAPASDIKRMSDEGIGGSLQSWLAEFQ